MGNNSGTLTNLEAVEVEEHTPAEGSIRAVLIGLGEIGQSTKVCTSGGVNTILMLDRGAPLSMSSLRI